MYDNKKQINWFTYKNDVPVERVKGVKNNPDTIWIDKIKAYLLHIIQSYFVFTV